MTARDFGFGAVANARRHRDGRLPAGAAGAGARNGARTC
jgi:hypothetical protein